MKKTNCYADALSYYSRMPKAVAAAVAVSALTIGGDYLDEADERVAREWWALYRAGIVPQRPNVLEPPDAAAVRA